ncbi:MAG: FixH family protein [Armatimonadetes bacterium]|nr:FixH family protein [Armatimonadota bacterium]
MSRYAYTAFCFLVLMLLVAGCGRKTEITAPGRTSAPAALSTAALGSEQAAGPFQVTLSANPSAPKVGNIEFTAKVVEKGQSVKNAKVKLTLEMPGMPGPSVALAPMDDHYMGSADVSMAGEWKAKVEIAAGSQSGTAEYAFTVAQ